VMGRVCFTVKLGVILNYLIPAVCVMKGK